MSGIRTQRQQGDGIEAEQPAQRSTLALFANPVGANDQIMLGKVQCGCLMGSLQKHSCFLCRGQGQANKIRCVQGTDSPAKLFNYLFIRFPMTQHCCCFQAPFQLEKDVVETIETIQTISIETIELETEASFASCQFIIRCKEFQNEQVLTVDPESDSQKTLELQTVTRCYREQTELGRFAQGVGAKRHSFFNSL